MEKEATTSVQPEEDDIHDVISVRCILTKSSACNDDVKNDVSHTGSSDVTRSCDLDTVIQIPSRLPFRDIVRAALVSLGYPSGEALLAKGFLLVNNWRRLSVDEVTDNPHATIGDLLGHVSSATTLHIVLSRCPNEMHCIKDKLLQFLLHYSQHVLSALGCPLDKAELLGLSQGLLSSDVLNDLQKKFNIWYDGLTSGFMTSRSAAVPNEEQERGRSEYDPYTKYRMSLEAQWKHNEGIMHDVAQDNSMTSHIIQNSTYPVSVIRHKLRIPSSSSSSSSVSPLQVNDSSEESTHLAHKDHPENSHIDKRVSSPEIHLDNSCVKKIRLSGVKDKNLLSKECEMDKEIENETIATKRLKKELVRHISAEFIISHQDLHRHESVKTNSIHSIINQESPAVKSFSLKHARPRSWASYTTDQSLKSGGLLEAGLCPPYRRDDFGRDVCSYDDKFRARSSEEHDWKNDRDESADRDHRTSHHQYRNDSRREQHKNISSYDNVTGLKREKQRDFNNDDDIRKETTDHYSYEFRKSPELRRTSSLVSTSSSLSLSSSSSQGDVEDQATDLRTGYKNKSNSSKSRVSPSFHSDNFNLRSPLPQRSPSHSKSPNGREQPSRDKQDQEEEEEDRKMNKKSRDYSSIRPVSPLLYDVTRRYSMTSSPPPIISSPTLQHRLNSPGYYMTHHPLATPPDLHQFRQHHVMRLQAAMSHALNLRHQQHLYPPSAPHVGPGPYPFDPAGLVAFGGNPFKDPLSPGESGLGDSPTSGDRRKRSRVFIDPLTEIPRLERWFAEDTHPSAYMIEQYTEELNRSVYRQRFPSLEPKNVQLWFKNHRAKVKRQKLEVSAAGSLHLGGTGLMSGGDSGHSR